MLGSRPQVNRYEYRTNPNQQNDRDKMSRFLENGDLCDIAIKVEGKTYKLHRCKLLSESGYFAHVFSAESSPSGHPNTEEEYLLDVEEVDKTSFEFSIKYIYYKEIELTVDNIVGILKAAAVLKIDNLLKECESWIVRYDDKILFNDVIELMNFIHRNQNVKLKYIYKGLLCKRILTCWSAVVDISTFCAISIDMLEEILVSSALHEHIYDWSELPANFCVENPDELLDMCTKWVIYDVQNRYQLVPRIALAINCNRMVHFNDYKMETVPDLGNCSEQFVQDQLSVIFRSTSLISYNTLSKNTAREFEQEPIFVTSSRTTIRILNADLDEIVSLWLYKGEYGDNESEFCHAVSATKIGDYLFIVGNIFDEYRNRIFFQAYDISSKKFTALAYLPLQRIEIPDYVLLNCRGNIYCCFVDGYILQYSMLLNRWKVFAKCATEINKNRIQFASDGQTLYRMYLVVEDASDRYITRTSKIFQMYDFDRNSWKSLPELTIRSNEVCEAPFDLIIVNGSDLAVLFSSKLYKFDSNGQRWNEILLPEECSNWTATRSSVTQCENGLLYVRCNKLYQHQLPASDQIWELKKEIKLDICSVDYELLHFGCISAVHRPAACINRAL